jgi:hypothetical protein
LSFVFRGVFRDSSNRFIQNMSHKMTAMDRIGTYVIFET